VYRRTFLASSTVALSGCISRSNNESEPSVETSQVEVSEEQDTEINDNGWRRGIGSLNSYPVVDEDYIYLSRHNGLNAIDITTGNDIWTSSLFREANAAPAITDNRLYVPDRQGDIYGFNRSGEETWRFEQSKSNLSSPVVSGDRLYTGGNSSNNYLSVISIDDEKLLWETSQSLGDVRDNLVYLTDYDRIERTGEVVCKYADSGEEKWNTDIFGAIYLADDKLWIYQADNKVSIHDLETGEFSHEFEPSTPDRGTLYYLEDQFLVTYLDNRRGRTTVYSFDKNDYSTQWEYQVDYVRLSTPTFHNGDIYFGGADGVIRVLDSKSGALQRRFNVGNKRIGKPQITEKLIIIHETNGDLVGVDREKI